MRRLTLVMALVALVGGALVVVRHHLQPARHAVPRSVAPIPPPPTPDLSGYAEVPVDDYFVDDQHLHLRYVYFRTPDGLVCWISGTAGCNGTLRGTPAPANAVELSNHGQIADVVEFSAFHQRSRPSGPAVGFKLPDDAKTLPVGHKLVYGDFQCATGAGETTMCSHGSPAQVWFVLSPNHSGIGPRTPGLPDKFPEPHDFVVDDQSYTTGSGGKNMFPYFTLASGLICHIRFFSGGALGCDGPLPGTSHRENEIYVDMTERQIGMRKTDFARFGTPPFPDKVRQLPARHRINYTYETYCTCMATTDGGVACYAGTARNRSGFVVSADSAWTFGGF